MLCSVLLMKILSKTALIRFKSNTKAIMNFLTIVGRNTERATHDFKYGYSDRFQHGYLFRKYVLRLSDLHISS